MPGQNITDYFEQDHDRLDRLFREFQESKRMDYAKARESFVAFKFGLQRHIIWEEDLLFPAFEDKTNMREAGPTVVMRMEHREIAEHLEAIHQKVKDSNADSDAEEQKLLAVLQAHNQKEENILYPTIDRMLNDQERAAIFEKMQNIPEERYKI